ARAGAARRGPTQELLRRGLPPSRAELLVLAPTWPQLVVQLALLRVGEHLVRFVDLLEARFRVLVAGVDVGVILTGQLAVRRADLFVGGAPFEAQCLVVVFKVHKPALS